jgi:hypothetical protein
MEIHRVEWDPDTPFYPALNGQLEDIHERLHSFHHSQGGFGSTAGIDYWIDQYNTQLRLLRYSNYKLWYNSTYHGNEGAYFAYEGNERT